MAKEARKRVFETTFDTYCEVKSIGSGGSGNVLHVKNEDGNSYALKYLAPENVTTQKLKRFKNELSFCKKNTHPNIVTVIDSGFVLLKKTKCPLYVMPLFNSTLRDLIKQKIPTDKVLVIFSQILDGVEAAHKLQIWHRDLKPENILYDTTSNRIVVADFGIAHFEEESLMTAIVTKPGDRLANFQYAAPEQRNKAAKVDHRADIFALGMILNEMFTGMPPYGVGYLAITQEAPQYVYLDDLVSKMMAQSPEQRPNSIDDIKKELIARQNAFITRQKLNELEKTVVPTSQITDPLVTDSVRVVSVDYEPGNLVLALNRPVNPQWVQAFKDVGEFTSMHKECHPSHFEFK